MNSFYIAQAGLTLSVFLTRPLRCSSAMRAFGTFNVPGTVKFLTTRVHFVLMTMGSLAKWWNTERL